MYILFYNVCSISQKLIGYMNELLSKIFIQNMNIDTCIFSKKQYNSIIEIHANASLGT